MIQMTDFKKEYAEIMDEVKDAIEKVLESGWYILGENVKNFEKKFAEYIGAHYAVGVNSGTDALLLSLMAAGVQRGDEIITVSHTTTPTVMPILLLGGKPKFVDIKSDTYTLDPSKLENKITASTKAVIPVHLYGQPCVMDYIKEICDKYSLVLLEDCCQAHGAFFKGKKVGTWGNLGAFSFYPTKNIGAYGDGGIVVTNSIELYEKLIELRQYGWHERYNSRSIGVNSRLDEIHAAILNVKLKHLEKWNTRRRKNAKLYNERLSSCKEIITPVEENDGVHVYHQYVILHKKRDRLKEFLERHGVQTQIHYPKPVHKQDIFLKMGYGEEPLPITEQISSKILSLPIHPFLNDEEIDTISLLIKRFER